MGSLLWYVIGITVFSLSAGAGNESPQTFTLDGQLYAADRTSPLIDAAAKIKVQILDPSRTCVLYEEEQPVDTTASGGHFTIQVGSIVGSTKRKSGDSGNTMQKVYQNTSAIPATGASCTGLYSPVMGAIRYVRVVVTPTAGYANTLSPDMVMDAVPNAMVAQSVQGLERENILQTNPAASLTQTKIEQFFMSLTSGAGSSVKYDGTNFVAYDPNNGSSLTPGTVADSAIGSVGWAKITSVPPAIAAVAGLSCSNGQILKFVSGAWACGTESGVGVESDPTVSSFAKTTPGPGLTTNGSNQIIPDFGSGAGKVVQGNDSRLSDSRAPNGSASGDLSGSYPSPTVAKIQGRGVSVTAPADGQVLRYDNGASLWVPTNFGIDDLKTSMGTAQFTSASCLASQTLIWSAVADTFSCVNISLPASQVTGTLPFSQVSGTVPIAQGGTGATTATAALNALLPSQSGQNGKILQSDGTNASWQTPAPSGVTSFNGSSQASQTFATPGVTGTAPNWSTNTGLGEHTLNIPMASTASVTAGLISKTDYDAFAAKLSSESDPKVGANTTNYLSKWNGSALVASGVIESGGLVGIGSVSPTTDVDIRNIQNGASGLRVYNNNSSTSSKGRIIFDNGTSSASLGHNGTGYTSAGGYQPNSSYMDSTGANGISVLATNAAGTVRFYTGGSANANERLRIDASGNVAIGTTTATTKLDVTGTVNATAFTVNGTPLATGTMSSLNGSSQATQTFANGTSGNAPAFNTVVGTGVHTLNIPMANTASVTAGLISKTEYDTFNNKVGTGYSLAGDVTGTPAATVVDRIKGVAVSAAPSSAGQILRYNGTQLAPAFLSMFDLRSTITGTQAFGGVGCLSNQTLTWTSATDNLACTNISLPVGQVTGTLPVANGGTGATTAAAAAAALLPSQASNSGKFLTTDGTNLNWATVGGGAPGGSTTQVQFNDAGAFEGATNFVWDKTNSRVGIGTATPGTPLDVVGSARVSADTAFGQLQLDSADQSRQLVMGYNTTADVGQIYANQTSVGGKTIAINPLGGAVAIGTTSAQAKLHIAGDADIMVDGTSPFMVFRSTTYPLNGAEVAGMAYVSEGSATATTWPPQASIAFLATENHSATNKGTNIVFGNVANGTAARAERMRIEQDGRVGIGTTAPQAALAVNGGIENNVNGEARHYRSVADKYLGAGVQTGTLKIKMPKTWSNTMMVVTIRGYDYTMNGGWEVVVSGYNYATTPSWINYSAEVRGTPPFTSVRLAHDGATNVILLGTTTTTWNYASVVVTDMIAHYAGSTGWGSGWTLSLITSEAGITNIVTPTIGQAWQTPTMQNGWVDYGSGYSPAGYMKESNGMVTLRGLVKSGTGGVCIFTLPAGYRPAYRGLFTTQASGSYARIDVLTDGCVNAYSSSTTWTSLEGIRFRAEQ